MSIFSGVPESKPDPILALNAIFAKDLNPKKVALAVGAYRDENGKAWTLPSVKLAEDIIHANPIVYNHEYPPQPGFPGFLKVMQEFLLGEDHPAITEKRVGTCQSLSGTGSLHVGLCFLHDFYKGRPFYMPSVTWPNHYAVYSKVYTEKYAEYTYLYKDGRLAIDFDAMKADMKAAPDGSIFLLHACAHNPSGVDLTKPQWLEILEIFKEKKHVPFFDVAYQGFATGSFEDDGYAVRLFAREHIECVVAQSCSKNFGLYGERVGACHVIHNGDEKTSSNCQWAMAFTIRGEWSMSPIHGAHIVQIIGENPDIKKQFLEDERTMAGRIMQMRRRLYEELQKLNARGSWEHILTCVGMFTFTGLTKAQVEHMRDKWAVYLVVQGGRMSMCGLTEANVAYVAEAMVDAIENVK